MKSYQLVGYPIDEIINEFTNKYDERNRVSSGKELVRENRIKKVTIVDAKSF